MDTAVPHLFTFHAVVHTPQVVTDDKAPVPTRHDLSLEQAAQVWLGWHTVKKLDYKRLSARHYESDLLPSHKFCVCLGTPILHITVFCGIGVVLHANWLRQRILSAKAMCTIRQEWHLKRASATTSNNIKLKEEKIEHDMLLKRSNSETYEKHRDG